MDFSIPDSFQATLNAVHEFMVEEVYPLEAGLGEEGFTATLPVLEEKREKVRANGWWAPQIPKEFGGMGLTLVEHGLLLAELGRSPIGLFLFNAQAPDSGNMEILMEFGSDEQKEQYLKPVVAGKMRSCFGMTEPEHAGSNPVWMSTTAVKDGEEWVINGHKWYTTSYEGASFCIVMAVTNPDAEPHMRASQIIVPVGTPGFEHVRNISVMGHKGEGWMSHGEVSFKDCRVPLTNILGPEGAGFMIAQMRLGPGRIHHCMRWIGVCERCFDILCDYAAKRELAPGRPLGTRQFVQGWIAESRAEINAAKMMVLHAAWTIEQQGSKAARDEISCIKFFVAGVMQKVMDRTVQALGGLGVCDDTPVAAFYRHERAARIYDGADEVHKASVAKRILRRYGINPEGGGAR